MTLLYSCFIVLFGLSQKITNVSSASFISQNPLSLISYHPRRLTNINTHTPLNYHHETISQHKSLPPTLNNVVSPDLSSSFMILTSKQNIALEDAFTDQINLNPFQDSTIQLILTSFGIMTLLAIIIKFFLNQMDNAIEKVLIDFESTMKSKYPSRWVSIEAKLNGLDDVKRSQRLFEIMEDLQVNEPDFMKKVNENMTS